MKTTERLDYITTLVDEQGYLSVRDLSDLCQVSEVTIRRDLERLEGLQRLHRTYGGAAALRIKTELAPESADAPALARPAGPLADRVDVLITTSLDPQYDFLLPELRRKAVSLIAESLPVEGAVTSVAVDNYQAGRALGRWAGAYVEQRYAGRGHVLDLTYHLPNTQARSRGFLAGLRERLPDLGDVLSLNALSRYETGYQLTHDALIAQPNINVIFAINDITAWGAINACKDLKRAPDDVLVIPFGLEGDTLKDALASGAYCRAGLAMFPEIVGRVLVAAAIAAHTHQPLPAQLEAPFAILTPETLAEFYTRSAAGWELCWEVAKQRLAIPLGVDCFSLPEISPVPQRIGFLVRFREHEWYKNLIAAMHTYAGCLEITIEVVDAEQTMREEVEMRRREIARCAAKEVGRGDVILMDGGPMAGYLAEELRDRDGGITVVTNARRAFDILGDNPDITLISTGGALRRSTQVLVGPTTEATLSRLRADKLFLMVTGVTLDFGLSHTDISEVTVKQAMIRSARRVILLADHTCFGHESMIQVAPASVVHKIISDDALPASWRLDLSRHGIEVILASM